MKDTTQRFFTWLVLLAMTAALTACGGGSDFRMSSASEKSSPRESSKAASTTNDYLFPLQQIYVGYFGRPADPGGLAYFAAQYQAAGAPTNIVDISKAYSTNPTLKALIDSFGTSAESQALYPGNNDTFINAIYLNLFNRNADTAGQQYWVNLINTGVMTRANAALSIIAGAQSTDIIVINKKSDVASRFTNSLTTPQLTAAYSGLAANVVVRSMLANVTVATDAVAFQANFGSVLATLQNTIARLASCPYTSLIELPAPNSCLYGTFAGVAPYSGAPCTLTISSSGVMLSSSSTVYAVTVGGTPPSTFLYSRDRRSTISEIQVIALPGDKESSFLIFFSNELVNPTSRKISASMGSLACELTT